MKQAALGTWARFINFIDDFADEVLDLPEIDKIHLLSLCAFLSTDFLIPRYVIVLGFASAM